MSIIVRKVLRRRPPKEYIGRYPNIYIDTAYISPDKPASLLYVKVPNEIGVLEKIARIIRSRGINIVKVNIPEIPVGNEAYVTLMLENCDQKCIEGVVNDLKDTYPDIILSIDSVTSYDSYLFIPYNQLIFIDRPAFILTTGMLREALRSIYTDPVLAKQARIVVKRFGEGVGKQIFEEWVSYIEKYCHIDWFKYIDKALRYFADFYKALNLGEIELFKIGETRYNIRIHNNMECNSLKPLGFVENTGYFTAGIITGYLEAVLNRRVVVRETKCVNKGSKYDEFEVQIYEYLM
ncbi:MAG: hypothetical protein B6U89_03235 [Desulfurococcales archaeon ex4484_58]|nr:MAG: hypothetical protein B6U89_03235 [Desulfurococcales archaeon ex4484_58]